MARKTNPILTALKVLPHASQTVQDAIALMHGANAALDMIADLGARVGVTLPLRPAKKAAAPVHQEIQMEYDPATGAYRQRSSV